MNQKLILENWRKFLKEEQTQYKAEEGSTKGVYSGVITGGIHTYEDLNKAIKNAIDSKKWDALKSVGIDMAAGTVKNLYTLFQQLGKLPDDKKTGTFLDKINIDDNFSAIVDDRIENQFLNDLANVFSKKTGPLPNDFNINKELQTFIANKYNKRTVATLEEKKKSKSGDRCTRIAKRKYDVWPSAYASGAVVKCRQGKIWKGISENMSDQEIDDALLLEEVEVIEEEWSEKHKRSIDCKNPKGFSQRAHCQGRKLNENTTSNQLEEVAKNTVLYFQGKVPKTILKNSIYFYYTKDEGAKDQVLDILNDPAKKKQYNEYWTKVKTKLEEISKNNNWTVTDDSAWFQMTKPYNTVKNPGNFKYYITFQKSQKFFDNVNKIGKLLTSLNSKKTTGKVSFKIASVFGSAYEHKDSIVIHFNYQQDQQSILEAVKEANFETVDRQKIGRTDLGRDEDTSDSDLIAIKAVENIEQNKNVLLPLLSAEKTSQEYKKGLSGIKHILDTLMQQSSHRNVTEAKKKDYKPNFSKEKEQGLHGWFARNDGKGWVNCRTGGPCGRDSTDKGGKYPACRPTKAQCKSAGKGPLRKKKSSSPISWTKKKKKD